MSRAGRALLACILVIAVLSLQHLPAGAQAAPRQLRIAVGIDPDTLDPAGQSTTTVTNMIDYFYEPLVDAEYSPGEIRPKLATRWQISPNGR